MQHWKQLVSVVGVVGLVAFGQLALAHGEFDEEQLAEFHEHMDDFLGEVEELVADVEVIVGKDRAGEADVDALIEHWEEVGVHAVIETRAMVTYPGIWQGIILLQQAVEAGDSGNVAAAGERLKAALWQAFGAVRLAASQVQSGTAPATVDSEARASGPETVARIIADLEQAVAEYRADNLAKAEALIHQTYMSRFEGIEGDLIARNPELVSSLEKDFNATLPLLMQQGAGLDEVNRALKSMKAQLADASAILESVEASRSEVF